MGGRCTSQPCRDQMRYRHVSVYATNSSGGRVCRPERPLMPGGMLHRRDEGHWLWSLQSGLIPDDQNQQIRPDWIIRVTLSAGDARHAAKISDLKTRVP